MGEQRRHYGWGRLTEPGALVWVEAATDQAAERAVMAARRHATRHGLRVRIRRGSRSGAPGVWVERLQAPTTAAVAPRARASAPGSALRSEKGEPALVLQLGRWTEVPEGVEIEVDQEGRRARAGWRRGNEPAGKRKA